LRHRQEMKTEASRLIFRMATVNPELLIVDPRHSACEYFVLTVAVDNTAIHRQSQLSRFDIHEIEKVIVKRLNTLCGGIQCD